MCIRDRAMATSMEYIYCGGPGETIFTTSDIGWAVGHSYIIYAPLIAGMTTIIYEGVPIRPDPGVWWKIVQDHKVNVMFSAPTAIRVLKKSDIAWLKKYDLSSLKHLFLAGEPLDEPTHAWISQGLGKPLGVRPDLHGFNAGGDPQGRLGAQAPCLTGHEVIEIDVHPMQRDRTLVSSGKQQEVPHQTGHPVDLVAEHRFGIDPGVRSTDRLGYVQGGAHRRQRAS